MKYIEVLYTSIFSKILNMQYIIYFLLRVTIIQPAPQGECNWRIRMSAKEKNCLHPEVMSKICRQNITVLTQISSDRIKVSCRNNWINLRPTAMHYTEHNSLVLRILIYFVQTNHSWAKGELDIKLRDCQDNVHSRFYVS